MPPGPKSILPVPVSQGSDWEEVEEPRLREAERSEALEEGCCAWRNSHESGHKLQPPDDCAGSDMESVAAWLRSINCGGCTGAFVKVVPPPPARAPTAALPATQPMQQGRRSFQRTSPNPVTRFDKAGESTGFLSKAAYDCGSPCLASACYQTLCAIECHNCIGEV